MKKGKKKKINNKKKQNSILISTLIIVIIGVFIIINIINNKQQYLIFYSFEPNEYRKDSCYIITDKDGIKNEDLNICNETSKDNAKEIAKYSCNSLNCEAFPINGDYVVIKDSNFYLYNFKNKKSQEISLDAMNVNYYVPIVGSNGNTLYYASNLNSNEYSYLFSKDGKVLVNLNQGQVMWNTPNTMKRDYIIYYVEDNNEITSFVYDIVNDEIIFQISGGLLHEINNGNYYYYSFSVVSNNEYKIYNKDFKLILDKKDISYIEVSNSGNLVTQNENESISIYDQNGKFIKTSKNYKSVLRVFENADYIAVVDNDNYLKFLDFDGKEVAKFINMPNDYSIMDLNRVTKNGKKAISIVVVNENTPSNETLKYIEYYYIPSTNETGKIIPPKTLIG